jgi:hypothetical protein
MLPMTYSQGPRVGDLLSRKLIYNEPQSVSPSTTLWLRTRRSYANADSASRTSILATLPPSLTPAAPTAAWNVQRHDVVLEVFHKIIHLTLIDRVNANLRYHVFPSS